MLASFLCIIISLMCYLVVIDPYTYGIVPYGVESSPPWAGVQDPRWGMVVLLLLLLELCQRHVAECLEVDWTHSLKVWIILCCYGVWPSTRQIWGIWKLRPAYSPETPNLGQNRWCFVPCDLEIWWMTLENNRASLLCCFMLCVTFHSHWWIQTGVTVRKRPIWVKFDDF